MHKSKDSAHGSQVEAGNQRGLEGRRTEILDVSRTEKDLSVWKAPATTASRGRRVTGVSHSEDSTQIRHFRLYFCGHPGINNQQRQPHSTFSTSLPKLLGMQQETERAEQAYPPSPTPEATTCQNPRVSSALRSCSSAFHPAARNRSQVKG